MYDQADALRRQMNNSSDGANSKQAEVIAVVSGKGGVGKSNFTLNFAISMQKMHKKVLVIDLDIGMANIDILLGQASRYSIVDMMNQYMPIWSIMEEGPEGLHYIAGGSGLTDLFEMDREKADHFYRQMSSAETSFDYIFLDMGAGVNTNSAYFLFSSHQIFLVTTPEPTSVTDAYAMIKYIHNYDSDLPVSLIINRSRSKKDGERTSENVRQVTRRFLGKSIQLLTVIPDDNVVWKAVRAQEPFVLFSPDSKPSRAVMSTVERFLTESGEQVDVAAQKISFISKLKGFLHSR